MAVQIPQPIRCYTPQEYLAFERKAEFKSEWLNGEIYAMSGGSPQHSSITVNVTSEIRSQLKGKPCQAFSNDMKVMITARPPGLITLGMDASSASNSSSSRLTTMRNAMKVCVAG